MIHLEMFDENASFSEQKKKNIIISDNIPWT